MAVLQAMHPIASKVQGHFDQKERTSDSCSSTSSVMQVQARAQPKIAEPSSQKLPLDMHVRETPSPIVTPNTDQAARQVTLRSFLGRSGRQHSSSYSAGHCSCWSPNLANKTNCCHHPCCPSSTLVLLLMST